VKGIPRKNHAAIVLRPLCWGFGHNWFRQKILTPHPADSYEVYECQRCGKRRGVNQHKLKEKGEIFEDGPTTASMDIQGGGNP